MKPKVLQFARHLDFNVSGLFEGQALVQLAKDRRDDLLGSIVSDFLIARQRCG
jgi:hypothetical protein